MREENCNQFFKLEMQTWRQVVPNFLFSSQPLPLLLDHFPFQNSKQPHFSQFLSPQHRSCFTVNPLLLVFLSPCHTLEVFHTFSLQHLPHVAAWTKSLHLFQRDWQVGSVWYEEGQKHLSCEDLWHPCAWVPALAAVSRLWESLFSHVFCLLHERLHFFLGLKMAVQTHSYPFFLEGCTYFVCHRITAFPANSAEGKIMEAPYTA